MKDSRQASYFDSLSQALKLRSTQENKEIKVDFLKGAEIIKLNTVFADVPEEKRAIFDKFIRLTAKASAVGVDEGEDEVTLQM